MPALWRTQAIREQSGMLTETANAKVAAEVLEAKSRTAEVEVSISYWCRILVASNRPTRTLLFYALEALPAVLSQANL